MQRTTGTSIKFLGLAAALALCLGAAAAAYASEPGGGDGDQNECHPACRQEKVTCKLGARTTRRSCAEECRASLQPQACFDQCSAAYDSTREGCGTTAQTCHDDCDQPGNQPTPCENACLADLKTCLGGLGGGGKQCWNDCVGAAQTASGACWTDPHPVQCLLGIAHDLSECLGGCALDMHEGADACKATAEACKQACEAGSASRAFLDARPSLLE